ncbi:MAG: hypothetical protein D6820_06695, partial [Lentisphaerae bacterium]
RCDLIPEPRIFTERQTALQIQRMIACLLLPVSLAAAVTPIRPDLTRVNQMLDDMEEFTGIPLPGLGW